MEINRVNCLTLKDISLRLAILELTSTCLGAHKMNNLNQLADAIKSVETRTGQLAYALVETLNGNYLLKPLAKAEARGDSIEMEFWGPDMESIKAQKKEHMAQMKADGLLFDYNNQ